MEAGIYWVGDLCYVMGDAWDEVCGLTFPDDGCGHRVEGEFTLADGRKFVIFGTAWGDGTYFDQDGRQYGVDAGVIGCIKLGDIRVGNDTYLPGGNEVHFPEAFESSNEDGVINFGGVVVIDTSSSSEDDEEWDDEEEDEDGED